MSSVDLREGSTVQEGNVFFYLPKGDVESKTLIAKDLYRQVVTNLPICCVDVFLFDPVGRAYLLVLRKDPPAQGVWWLPGGRLYKGETSLQCGERKCREELGLDVTAKKVLDVCETFFPDSMWDTQTHSVNMIVFAIVNKQDMPVVDATCETYRWQQIDCPPEDKYVLHAYQKATAWLGEVKEPTERTL